jgi:5'-deoxynucleotidase YfbR-like HD superfamily hydrolase
MIKDAFEVIDSMSALTRYSQAHNITRESVLEHTAFVALFGAAICARVNHNPTTVLRRAIVHDIDEIVTGDIPPTTKYANIEIANALKIVEKEGAELAIGKLFTRLDEYDDWKDAKDETMDGYIIRIADIGSVVFKMSQEASLGNKTLLKYKNRLRKVFLEMLEIEQFKWNGLGDIVIELSDILEDIE